MPRPGLAPGQNRPTRGHHETILSIGDGLAAPPDAPLMERYEIRLASVIDPRRARALGCEPAADDLAADGPAADGLAADVLGSDRPATGSLLSFEARDQAALYGLLARLRDMGIELLDVHRVEPPAEPIARMREEEQTDVP